MGLIELGLSHKRLSQVAAPPCINAVSPPSPHKTIEHGCIETNELNMTLMSHMTHHDLV